LSLDNEPAVPASPERSLTYRLGSNFSGQLLPPVVRGFLGLATLAMISRYLGPSGFGRYAVAFAVVLTTSGLLNDWGLSTIALRECSQRPEESEHILSSAFGLQSGIAVTTYLLLAIGTVVTVADHQLVAAILLVGLGILFSPISILALSLQAELRSLALVPAAIFGAVTSLVLAVAVVRLNGGLVLVIAAVFAGTLVQNAVVIGVLIRRWQRVSRPERAEMVRLLRESWPLGLASITTTLFQQLPLLVLARTSLQAAGLFSAANRIPIQAVLLPMIIRNATFPVLARSWVEDRTAFWRRVTSLMQLNLVLMIPATIFAVGVGGPMMGLLFGRAFGTAGPTFALLMAGLVVLAPSIILGEALIAAGMQRTNLVLNAAVSPFFIGGVLLLAARAGAPGAAGALLLAYLSLLLAALAVAVVRLGFTTPWASVLPGAGAGALGGVVLVAGRGPLGPLVATVLASATALLVGVAASTSARGAIVAGVLSVARPSSARSHAR
jgi:O-antigen/teichoic acid export membrane protein